jgi:hypothetical protein
MPPSGERDQARPLHPAAFAATDYWRSAPSGMSDGDKEWSHFSVLSPDFDLLANFSLTARRSRSGGMLVSPRVTFLLRDSGGGWDGDVQAFAVAQTAISEGSPNAAIGDNGAWFEDGRYRIQIKSTARKTKVALDLTPVTPPLLAHSVKLSGDDAFSWTVVPRLRADGEVVGSGIRYMVRGAPAYHDRNWGRFAWGGNYAWEWATIVPPNVDQKWCLVYSRITDRHQSTTVSQSLMLWRRDRLSRKFYGRDLKIEQRGLLRIDRPLRIPRAAALVLPGLSACTPRELLVTARGYGDALSLHITFDDFAEVVFPTDRWPGMTTLRELRGRAGVSGRIGVERLDFEARVQAEINHAT